MRYFLLKLTFFFLILILANAIAVLVMPMDAFTYRNWETVKPYILSFPGPFYPHQDRVMIEEGDLGHDTIYAHHRSVRFITDSYGYRYENLEKDEYSIVVVGDSAVAGTGLTQEEILTDVLSRKTGQAVYPLAPGTIDAYFSDPRFQESPPDVLILESVERNINESIGPGLCNWSTTHDSTNTKIERDNQSSFVQALQVYADRMLRNPVYFAGFMNSRLNKRPVILGEGDSLFYGPALEMSSLDDIERVVDGLESCSELFRTHGIEFVFLPIPDKGNILFNLIPNDLQQTNSIQPRNAYLRTLIDKLIEKDVQVIDTLQAFEHARSDGLEIYQPDDTHWNAEAVRITADLIEQLLADYSLD